MLISKKETGDMKPTWAWFGYGEPNYEDCYSFARARCFVVEVELVETYL